MSRADLPDDIVALLKSAKRIADQVSATAVLMLAQKPYDFTAVAKLVRGRPLIVASEKPDVQHAAQEDEAALVQMLPEPQSTQNQLSQALLDAIADELVQTGDRVVALYSIFDNEQIDTVTSVHLSEHLARLTSRDLQRLETQVPLETLRQVVDLAVEIGREGREGKPVGTMFVVGNHRKVMPYTFEQVHDPFRGYGKQDCLLRSSRVRESIKELAQIDGAFIISSDGIVQSAGRFINAPATGIIISQGLGTRHWAAAAISRETNAVAVAVSESTGTVRVFQNGVVVLRIEPMDRGMTWQTRDDAEQSTL